MMMLEVVAIGCWGGYETGPGRRSLAPSIWWPFLSHIDTGSPERRLTLRVLLNHLPTVSSSVNGARRMLRQEVVVRKASGEE